MTLKSQTKNCQNKEVLSKLVLLNSKIQTIRTFLVQQGYSSAYIKRHLASIIKSTQKFRSMFKLSNSNTQDFLRFIIKDQPNRKENLQQLVTLFEIQAQKCSQQVYNMDPIFEIREAKSKLKRQVKIQPQTRPNQLKIDSLFSQKKQALISRFDQSIEDSIMKAEMLHQYVQSKLRITDIYRQRLQKMSQEFDQISFNPEMY